MSMKRYRNGGKNEYTYGYTTGQHNSNDWVIGRHHHVFYRGVDKMSDKNYNISITCSEESLEKIECYLALLELMENISFEIEED